MSPFEVPQSVRANQQKRALARRPKPCLLCQQWTRTVLYPAGWHCLPCAASRGLSPVRETPPQARRTRADAQATGHPNDQEEAAPA